jgi:hypothetical protein
VGIDFPFVCETCLGPNPYVRMVKSPPGHKLCHLTGRPFQSFRWRAGPGGRWKECMVEAAVAKDKNICQACLVDMTYGVPVGVRDALLAGTPPPHRKPTRCSQVHPQVHPPHNESAAVARSQTVHPGVLG